MSTFIPDASKEAIDLIESMLKWNPNDRPSCQELLQHPFFTNFSIPKVILTSLTASASSTQLSFKSNWAKEKRTDPKVSSLVDDADCLDLNKLIADLKKQKDDPMQHSNTFSQISSNEKKPVYEYKFEPQDYKNIVTKENNNSFKGFVDNSSSLFDNDFFEGSRRNKKKNSDKELKEIETKKFGTSNFDFQQKVLPQRGLSYGQMKSPTIDKSPEKSSSFAKPNYKDCLDELGGIKFEKNNDYKEDFIGRRKVKKEESSTKPLATEPFQFESKRLNKKVSLL